MQIFIVIEKKANAYHDDFSHMSFDNRSEALNHAVDCANGSNGFGDDVSLHRILKLDTAINKVIECELALIGGKFELKRRSECNHG